MPRFVMWLTSFFSAMEFKTRLVGYHGMLFSWAYGPSGPLFTSLFNLLFGCVTRQFQQPYNMTYFTLCMWSSVLLLIPYAHWKSDSRFSSSGSHNTITAIFCVYNNADLIIHSNSIFKIGSQSILAGLYYFFHSIYFLFIYIQAHFIWYIFQPAVRKLQFSLWDSSARASAKI